MSQNPRRIDYDRNTPIDPAIRITNDMFLGTGNVLYVDNSGQDKSHIPGMFAYSSIKIALTHCLANRGDVIHCLPGHVETVISAAELDMNVAGVTVIGHGRGKKRAQIEFTTAATAYLHVTAGGVTFLNIDFRNKIDNLAKAVLLAGYGTRFDGCRFINHYRNDYETLIWVDYADLSLTDLVSADGDTATGATVTSATGGFHDDMVGASLEVTAGTSWTAERHTIIAVNSSTSITIRDAAGSATSLTSGSGSISKANDVVINNCLFDNVTLASSPGATAAINIAGITEGWEITECKFDGFWSTACINAITIASYEMLIEKNVLINRDATTGMCCIDLVAGCEGLAKENNGTHLYATTLETFDLASLDNQFNYSSNVLTEYGILHGVASS